MAVAPKISDLDMVELTGAVDDAPAGARGGVLEIRDDGIAMVEILDPPLGPAARIVFVPAESLRLVSSWRSRGGSPCL